MILTKQQILDSHDLKRETVNVKEWGGVVLVQTMTGTERDAWEQSLVGEDRKRDLVNARAKLLSRCIVDESGNRLFSDDDIQSLGGKSSRALERVARVAQRLNALGDADIEDALGN